jgi:glyoxylase-like metal-dependent hydrolase (beta-lactamase superfamily II)
MYDNVKIKGGWMPGNLIFQQLFDAESSTFTYLLGDRSSKEAVLIDPVLENVDRDLKLIGELGLTLIYVLDTHIHADHITGAGEIRRRSGAKSVLPVNSNANCVDQNIQDQGTIQFGKFSIKAISTPRHTDASFSYFCEGMIFTGDALLIRGTGRTDFQGGSADHLFDSVTKRLFTLPPETKVYPAHDYKGFTSSTIEAEIRHNSRLGNGRSKEEFIEIMAALNELFFLE